MIDKHKEDSDDDQPTGSQLRRQVAPLLAEEDVRYAGKKVSRKKLSELDDDFDASGKRQKFSVIVITVLEFNSTGENNIDLKLLYCHANIFADYA